MCDEVTEKVTRKSLYIKNREYPNAVIPPERSCSCSVETESCSSQIRVYFIHFQLGDGGESCKGKQKIEIDDNENIRTFTCANNSAYEITLKMTSSSNYMTISFVNPDSVQDGYVWIGFEGIM